MFFLIGGVQPKTILIERHHRACPSCGHSELYLKRVDHYFSLFFIPLFPVKRGIPFLACKKCRTVFEKNGKTSERVEREYKKCQNCGKTTQPEFSYCPYCGKFL